MGANTPPERRDPKPLKPRQAADRLGIAIKDLPDFGRPLTNADVRALRAERPDWLTVARRRFGAASQARAQAAHEATLALSRRIEEAGWVTANDGTDAAIALYDALALRAHHEWGVDLDQAYEAVDVLLPETGTWHNYGQPDDLD
jgi:hypothetical protein